MGRKSANPLMISKARDLIANGQTHRQAAETLAKMGHKVSARTLKRHCKVEELRDPLHDFARTAPRIQEPDGPGLKAAFRTLELDDGKVREAPESKQREPAARTPHNETGGMVPTWLMPVPDAEAGFIIPGLLPDEPPMEFGRVVISLPDLRLLCGEVLRTGAHWVNASVAVGLDPVMVDRIMTDGLAQYGKPMNVGCRSVARAVLGHRARVGSVIEAGVISKAMKGSPVAMKLALDLVHDQPLDFSSRAKAVDGNVNDVVTALHAARIRDQKRNARAQTRREQEEQAETVKATA